MNKLTRIGRLALLSVALSIFSGCERSPDEVLYAPGLTVYAVRPTEKAPVRPRDSYQAPAGMVFIPGGITRIGAVGGEAWEKPLFWIKVHPFFMDQNLVTVADFRRFVRATGYQTQAEKFGDGAVLDEQSKAWVLKKGASWEYPRGEGQEKASDNHPVTQVSWNDAQAYARWAGKRLPYEFEWEHAARNGVNSQTLYPFGNKLTDNNGKALANTWNGTFPVRDAVTDKFHYTSPVGFFGKTPLGLTDMTGNVWEWCADWKQEYADVVAGRVPESPTEKVQRGGSFLCEPGWCHGYRISGRSFSTPETALMHVGFRCVKSIEE